jgi:fructokinase
VGAVLYQLDGLKIQDLDFSAWKKMVENANKAGARTCEYLGAMEAFKNLNNSIFN